MARKRNVKMHATDKEVKAVTIVYDNTMKALNHIKKELTDLDPDMYDKDFVHKLITVYSVVFLNIAS